MEVLLPRNEHRTAAHEQGTTRANLQLPVLKICILSHVQLGTSQKTQSGQVVVA